MTRLKQHDNPLAVYPLILERLKTVPGVKAVKEVGELPTRDRPDAPPLTPALRAPRARERTEGSPVRVPAVPVRSLGPHSAQKILGMSALDLLHEVGRVGVDDNLSEPAVSLSGRQPEEIEHVPGPAGVEPVLRLLDRQQT